MTNNPKYDASAVRTGSIRFAFHVLLHPIQHLGIYNYLVECAQVPDSELRKISREDFIRRTQGEGDLEKFYNAAVINPPEW